MYSYTYKQKMFNISITDNTKAKLTKFGLESIEKRITSKCNVFADYIENIKVKISKSDKNTFSVKIVVITTHKNEVITAISSKEDLFDAVDDVRNKIYTQLEKTKGRYMNKRVKEEVVEMPIENTYDDYESLSNKYDVVKIKTRDVKPMLVEEAIEQMNLLKHDFFIYLDAETNVVNVIYRRKQGDYGLIETVISNKE